MFVLGENVQVREPPRQPDRIFANQSRRLKTRTSRITDQYYGGGHQIRAIRARDGAAGDAGVPGRRSVPQDAGQQPAQGGAPQEAFREPLIKVRPPSALQYPLEEASVTPVVPQPPPRLLSKDTAAGYATDGRTDAEGRMSPDVQPADLSNKRPENLTCVPEIDFIKEEGDNVSVYSNSSDPERLEVDMSQATEEHSNSTTHSAASPTPEAAHRDPSENDTSLWRALSHNGYNPQTPLSGEASQLLRKLITCRKLGMSITPAPPHVLNYTLFQDQQQQHQQHRGAPQLSGVGAEKSSARRKQSFPTRASVQAEGTPPSRRRRTTTTSPTSRGTTRGAAW
ncbi:hypothetical protein NQ318_019186 [Aromia moschata]|uniref:Uncharacterized protein n=1 Tax=Aromia moschata TaxID=1265417 RepID=A0AAV8YQG5_9CUCU|nr:hypothetical protein NQ318_019186 [Aromia moschata]